MQVVLALIPIVAGVFVGIGGLLGWRGKLSRDTGAGLRTAATLRSDEAFAVGNRVAALPTMAAGVVGIASGLAALAMPTDAGAIVAAVIGIVGVVGLVYGGGVMGSRAAAAVPEPKPARTGCGGCGCGGGGCGATE
ncbi:MULTISPECIES: SdpI family protein [Thermocrispum]|uniref:SdpI family protein n=1 Tax=Thermocrispum agreste TaxID=37925 RepID=A0ABD6FCD3_9PSEU|nr:MULTISPECIES: SdpI family protein [Thermocrispum]